MKKKLLFLFALLCMVAQGAWADNIDLSTVTEDVEAKNGDVLTGTTSTYKVTIAGGAKVTLSGVTINGSNTAENVCCIKCEGSATIILAEGTTNELTCFGYYSTALRAGGSGTTLTIQGTGALTAKSGWRSAGIGGVMNTPCGDITIKGGTIEAFGGGDAPGIGGGYNSSCGNITITKDVTSVSTVKHESAQYGIGKGNDGTCGTITLGDMVFYDGTSYLHDGLEQSLFTFANIDKGPVTIEGRGLIMGTSTNPITLKDESTVMLSNVNISRYGWCMKCEGDAVVILADGTTNTLTSTAASLTNYPALWVGNEGTTLTIMGETAGTGKLIAQGAVAHAAIGGGHENTSKTCGNIVIQGGIITASGGFNAPGIGADDGATCGNITITSGVTRVTASKGSTETRDCIGRGYEGSCGTVTIGGIGYNENSEYVTLNQLTIASVNKAAVTVPDSKYYLVIGDGNETGNQITLRTSSVAVLSNVNISNVDYCLKCEGDATVILADGTTNTLTSTSNNYPAYPALWVGDAGTTTTIQGTGKLVAQGGAYCAAIGGGLHNTSNSCGNIRIEGGIIDATGSSNAVAIGADYAPDGNTQCGNITITNGVTSLIAKGAEGEGIDCIGRYTRSSCGAVTIGGVVYQSDDDYIGQHALYFLKGNGDGTGKYWTTYYDRENNLLASEGTQVFKAGLSGIELTLTPISDRVVNSLQGVILKSSSDHFLLATRTGVSSDSYDGNVLTGTMTTIPNPGPANNYNCYVLNKGDEGVGFYKLSDTGTIGAHKAYLKYNGVVGGAREFFGFDEATGLKDVIGQKEEGSGDYYDLQGRKVAQPSKGLYIKDGKKYIKM
ncbi:MAG: hypothetical protein IKQ59_01440 [Prevotella sp.]|nr:hypothetical protein [Prevotella sp.]